jgi:hypothetical protein
LSTNITFTLQDVLAKVRLLAQAIKESKDETK